MPRKKKEISPENPTVTTNEPVNNDKLDELVQNYNADKDEQIHKRTRKSKKPVERSASEIESEKNFAETATFSVHTGLEILLARMPKPSPLTTQESEAFDKAFTELAKKYFPTVQRFGAELNLVVALSFIILPRIDFDKISGKNGQKNSNNIRQDGNGKEYPSQVVNAG